MNYFRHCFSDVQGSDKRHLIQKLIELTILSIILLFLWAGTAKASDDFSSDFTDLSLEALMNLEVLSVSKKPESLANAAAAIYVITNKDLSSYGVTSVPQALRMVPGLNIGSIGSSKWAVTARGFNGRFANKLLVMIDGRTVYNPVFSGVFWEAVDVMIEDVERIEVIRGPGATLWGANAVNGVINIITKKASETQGGLLTLGAGNEEKGFGAIRYGKAFGENSHIRGYCKGFKRDEGVNIYGDDAGDNWNMLRSGFRMDSKIDLKNKVTLQGDLYQGDIDQTILLATLSDPYLQTVRDEADYSGYSLASRLQHKLSDTSDYTLQIYYDHSKRNEVYGNEKQGVFDVDFQHAFEFTLRHEIIWGIAYRHINDKYIGKATMSIDPNRREDDLFSGFFQDRIRLIEERLWLTLGSKFEYNDYSGFEIQPSLRVSFSLNQEHNFWTAISRAVRTPSRAEHDITIITSVIPPLSLLNPQPFPIALTVTPDKDYESEELIAYELGYRLMPDPSLSIDMSIFYNNYKNLRANHIDAYEFQTGYLVQPFRYENTLKGNSYGIEMTAIWQAATWWQWKLSYSLLEVDLNTHNQFEEMQNGDGPKHQVSLGSNISFKNNLSMNLWFRFVDDVLAIDAINMDRLEIDSYLTLDIRLAWQASDNIEFCIVGQNLLDEAHPEYLQETFIELTEIERSVYGKVTWRF